MQINDQEYRHIIHTIKRLTAIDELAAYRAELRIQYRGDPKLARVDRRIDFRVQELLSARHERG